MDKLILGGHEFDSRLLIGTGKFGSNDILPEVIKASNSEIITMAIRRVDLDNPNENILTYIPKNMTIILADEGFVVLPYMSPDLYAGRRLIEAGAAAVMPLGAPIGSNRGLKMKEMIQIMIDELDTNIIVDAGIGKPSQAMEAMEMGAAAVLVNSAISSAQDPVKMANAFRLAVEGGREAYLGKTGPVSNFANASSPLTGFLGSL